MCSDTLAVGSCVLLPPTLERVKLLLSLLPPDPKQFNQLTGGQVHHYMYNLFLLPVFSIVSWIYY